jgi:putative ABC transport system substrate-binding protein
MAAEVVGKSLELLREAVPNLSRIAVLWNPENAIFQAQMLREAQIVAGKLSVELQPFGARTAGEINQAFVAMSNTRLGALLALADPVLAFNRLRIVEAAARDHLQAVYGSRDYGLSAG